MAPFTRSADTQGSEELKFYLPIVKLKLEGVILHLFLTFYKTCLSITMAEHNVTQPGVLR